MSPTLKFYSNLAMKSLYWDININLSATIVKYEIHNEIFNLEILIILKKIMDYFFTIKD